MKRADLEPRQLPLLSAADMAPQEDRIGAALGVVGADPDTQWALVMDQFGRMAARAYSRARDEAKPAD